VDGAVSVCRQILEPANTLSDQSALNSDRVYMAATMTPLDSLFRDMSLID
jgi:hypothetical protein